MIVIIGVVAGGKDDSTKKDAATPVVSGAASSKPAAVKPKPVAKSVLAESGSGIKSTSKFTVDGDWDLKYSYDCSKFGSQGNFVVSVGGGLGDVLLNELGKSGSDTTHLHDGGTKYLEINSECSWKIDVIDVP